MDGGGGDALVDVDELMNQCVCSEDAVTDRTLDARLCETSWETSQNIALSYGKNTRGDYDEISDFVCLRLHFPPSTIRYIPFFIG